MAWILAGKFDEWNEDAVAEKKRWEDVAYDIGFIPERVVQVQEEEGEIRVLIDQDLYDYFRQGL